jgi:hypothetical protein
MDEEGSSGQQRVGTEGREVGHEGAQQWVGEELDLPEDTTVVVSELTCTEPGCPPLETVVSVFPEGMDSLLVKMAKPVADVGRADLVAALAGGEHHH